MATSIKMILTGPVAPPISLVITKLGSPGPAGASGGRTSSSNIITSTDADVTATPGNTYYLPTGGLTQNRNFNLSALNTEGDYIEIINNEHVYNWNLTGQAVYYANGFDTVGVLFADTNYMIRLIAGKLRILN